MKKIEKLPLLIAAILIGLVLLMLISFWYVTGFRHTDIDTQTSPDGRCQLTLQMEGEPEWPFGSTDGRIIVSYDDKVIKKIKFMVQDDGSLLTKGNWEIAWGVAGVQITLKGSEQENQVLQVMYDGTEEFYGYSEMQITEEMRKRYGDVRIYGKEGELYCYDTGSFLFLVKNDLVMSDNYKMEAYRYLTDAYFAGRNRSHSYEENGTGIEKKYTPVIALNSSASEEKEWFCTDVVNWLLYVMEKLPFEENKALYREIKIAYNGEELEYQLPDMQDFTQENISSVYNPLYDFIENALTKGYEEWLIEAENTNENEGEQQAELTEDEVQYYLSLPPDCSYETADGVEYRMVPIDRACGSSYYALLAVADGGRKVVMVNRDPYLGSGGGAVWIDFLQDGKTGFSCLAYSGGAYGLFYRTEDGGKSFETVEYPSAKVELPDGTYYNPFVMPQKVYEEDGKLYMEAGQGADGDYHGKDKGSGLCRGLYESLDNGKTWTYIREIT